MRDQTFGGSLDDLDLGRCVRSDLGVLVFRRPRVARNRVAIISQLVFHLGQIDIG